jgi:hypothetical protein
MTTKEKQVGLHSERFPGESAEYRSACDRLLEAEIELRRRLEDVAKMRRQLPPGGAVPQDYEFEEGSKDLDDHDTIRRVKLSELFTRPDNSLIIYSFMFGPKMPEACPSCTSILDGSTGPPCTRLSASTLSSWQSLPSSASGRLRVSAGGATCVCCRRQTIAITAITTQRTTKTRNCRL